MRPGDHHEVEVTIPPGHPLHPAKGPCDCPCCLLGPCPCLTLPASARCTCRPCTPAIAIAMTVTVADLAHQDAVRESSTLRALDRMRMRG